MRISLSAISAVGVLGYTLDGVGLVVHGVDTVMLGTINAVAQGKAEHTVLYDGVAYYFASQATAERFKADPQRYLSQFGGFCAYAVALGRKHDGDPRLADIVDGRLYHFVNAAIFEPYLAGKEGRLKKANEQWPQIVNSRVEDL